MDELEKSKVITQTEDGGMALIKDILDGQNTGGFDIDSMYFIKDQYFVIELLFCDKFPVDKSHPSRYFYKNSQKFISLFNVAKKLEGRLLLINYEKTHQKFKVMECVKCDKTGIVTKDDTVFSRQEFSKWFQSLNKHNYIEIPNFKNKLKLEQSV